MRFAHMTVSAFSRDPGKACEEADKQPLLLTEYGEARYVLIPYAEFQKNWRPPKSLYEALRDTRSNSDDDFDPERVSFESRALEF